MRNNRAICVDLVLQSSVKVLLLDRIGHDNQEEVQVLGFLWLLKLAAVGVLSADVLHVVVIDSFLECLDTRLVAQLNNVSIVHVNFESSLLR